MCRKIFAGIVILAALTLAILVSNVPIDYIDNVMFVVKFFEVMIPVLGVGALIKYLWSGHGKKCGCCNTCSCACGKCGCCSTKSKPQAKE